VAVSDGITPGERRELRTVVKGQFKVLRAEVRRREQELRAEVESELLSHYRLEDEAVYQAKIETRKLVEDCARAVQEVGAALKEQHPDLEVEAGRTRMGGIDIHAANPKRSQLHRALLSSIPNRVGDANLSLDRQEVDLLRKLSEGAIETESATSFLSAIPTVGELVPAARLKELTQGLDLDELDA
jgi:hypothetical protein